MSIAIQAELLSLSVPQAEETPAAAARSFQALVRQHHDELVGRARRLCRGHLDADDVLQDALVRAWKAFAGMRDASAGRAWLFTILNHTFIDRVRKQHGEPRMDTVDELVLPAPERPATARWERLGLDDLRAAIAALPDDVREVYRQHALDGRDYIYLADKHGIPKSTVGTRLLRARKKLREHLEARLAELEGGR
jgi:RNA polymerase sigma-70 factor, ECF subfamily